MNLPSIDLLVAALADPPGLARLQPKEWDLLIRQARNADLLARLGSLCASRGVMGEISPRPRQHLQSAANVAARQGKELRWEVEQIADALAAAGQPTVLLKGAAYALAGLPIAAGRMVSDVDVLVPRAALVAVESALMKKGWVSEAKTAYDQRYYRTWMHELPPMRHIRRGTVIDVHHAILPTTSRLHPCSEKLLGAAVALPGDNRLKVLAPVDMLLHSATHLFHEGELDHGFRDLMDILGLVGHFGAEPEFWERLVPRAEELELTRPLFYALRYANLMLGTRVPPEVTAALAATSGGRRLGAVLGFMDALFLRALRPVHLSTSDRYTPLARWLLYLRGHWLRMPPGLLCLHLARKAITGGGH